MLRSFRFRLIVAFVALFAAVSVAVSFTGMLLREQQVKATFDKDLRLVAGLISSGLTEAKQINREAIESAVRPIEPTLYFREFYVQVFDESAQPIARSANLQQDMRLRRPVNDRSMDNVIVQSSTDGYYGVDGPQQLRGLRVRFRSAGGREYIAIIAADPRYMTESLSMMRWLLVAGNIGGLAAAGAAAWFVTGAMSKRLGELTEQIEQVGPQDLARRIQIQDRDEIAELATHINAMLDRLKAGFDTQERFIHDASHELKTPVATVQAEAQALLLSDPTRSELLEFVKASNEEMRRLGRLTEALLLLTRTDDNGLNHRLTTIELTEAATAAIRHLSPMASDHQVQVRVDPDEPDHAEGLFVECDPDLLEAMISNLVRNAIRFSPRGGEVRIGLGSTGGLVHVVVEDEGPGIPDDVLPRIFDAFFESSQSRVRRGAGLGLAIASTVARLHGGRIRAENRTEGGARFSVELPRAGRAPDRGQIPGLRGINVAS